MVQDIYVGIFAKLAPLEPKRRERNLISNHVIVIPHGIKRLFDFEGAPSHPRSLCLRLSRQSSISSNTGPSSPLIGPQPSPELVHVNDADFPNAELDLSSDDELPNDFQTPSPLTPFF